MEKQRIGVGTFARGGPNAPRPGPAPADREPDRIAHCECGAKLAGASEQELFAAAERHVARCHPQLLGALRLDVVRQMAENLAGR